MNIIILVVFIPFSLLFICFVRLTFFPSRFRYLETLPPSLPPFLLSFFPYFTTSYLPFRQSFWVVTLSLQSASFFCCANWPSQLAFPAAWHQHGIVSWRFLCGGSRRTQRACVKRDLFKCLALTLSRSRVRLPVKAIKLCDLFRSVSSRSKLQVKNASLSKW